MWSMFPVDFGDPSSVNPPIRFQVWLLLGLAGTIFASGVIAWGIVCLIFWDAP